MILYEFECENAKCFTGRFETFCKPGEAEAECPVCGKQGHRLFSPPTVTVTFRPGWDAGMGEYVDTKRERTRLMEEKHLEPITG